MSLMRLIQDWWRQEGPEHWDPECDEDVAYFRDQRRQAYAEVDRLQRLRTGNVVEEHISGVATRQTRRYPH
jgi:hypothetical protein